MTLTLKKKNTRSKLMKYLKKKGIETRPMINPIEDGLHFKKHRNSKESKIARIISKNSIHLPSATSLSDNQIKYICSALNKFNK